MFSTVSWGPFKILTRKANETKARELTNLLFKGIEHHEESGYPKQSACAALLPLAIKIAKVHKPCSKMVKQTKLMEGLGHTYSQNYDLRPRRK